jgi:hypothetical protein
MATQKRKEFTKTKKEGKNKRVSKSKTHLIIISIEYCK